MAVSAGKELLVIGSGVSKVPTPSPTTASSVPHHQPYPHADHPLGPRTLPRVPGKRARQIGEAMEDTKS